MVLNFLISGFKYIMVLNIMVLNLHSEFLFWEEQLNVIYKGLSQILI